MRNTRAKLAQRLHLLRLMQLALGRRTLRDSIARPGKSSLLPARPMKSEEAEHYQSHRRRRPDQKVSRHRVKPLMEDRRLGPADGDIDRIVGKAFVSDDAAPCSERRAVRDDAAQ